ncbi:MAG: hypothetical protein AB7G28_23940 [Pirellulales bacterium]
MAIDIREISLTEEQKRRIARLAEHSGKTWKQVIDEHLESSSDADDLDPLVIDPGQYIEDREKWLTYFEKWLAERKTHNPHFDDSRASIYPDRG